MIPKGGRMGKYGWRQYGKKPIPTPKGITFTMSANHLHTLLATHVKNSEQLRFEGLRSHTILWGIVARVASKGILAGYPSPGGRLWWSTLDQTKFMPREVTPLAYLCLVLSHEAAE